MPGELEQGKFDVLVFVEIEAHRAVMPAQVRADAGAGPSRVNLVQAGLRTVVGDSPSLDAAAVGAAQRKVFLHGATLEQPVFDILDQLDCVIVEKFKRIQPACRQMGPTPAENAETDARIVSGHAVAERKCVQRENDGRLEPGIDRDIDMVDIFLALRVFDFEFGH